MNTFLSEESRSALLAHALPRWSVRHGDYVGWVVYCGAVKVAVFDMWRDAVAFARWKATT